MFWGSVPKIILCVLDSSLELKCFTLSQSGIHVTQSLNKHPITTWGKCFTRSINIYSSLLLFWLIIYTSTTSYFLTVSLSNHHFPCIYDIWCYDYLLKAKVKCYYGLYCSIKEAEVFVRYPATSSAKILEWIQIQISSFSNSKR